jgi:hypothetical protein
MSARSIYTHREGILISVVIQLLSSFLILCLSSCANWSPLYSDANSHYSELSSIRLGNFSCECDHKVKYDAVTHLKRIVGGNEQGIKEYSLNLKIKSRQMPLAITINSIATRTKIFVELEYTLLRVADGKIIAQDKIVNIETLAVLRSTFSNFLAEEEMMSDMLKMTMEDLRLELLSIMHNGSTKHS